MSETFRTLSEIRATCTKAARGAGCTWGMAEEAGLAARALASHGLPGAETVATLFDTPRACACDGTGTASCGLLEMAALSDAPPEGAMEFVRVAAPLLLAVPFLSGIRGRRIDWRTGAATCGHGGVTLTGGPAPKVAERVVVSLAEPERPGTPADWHSRPVADSVWSRLESLAARTYVPESAASRSTGAGPDAADAD